MYTTIPLYKCDKCLIFLPHASLFKIIIKVTQNKSKNNSFGNYSCSFCDIEVVTCNINYFMKLQL